MKQLQMHGLIGVIREINLCTFASTICFCLIGVVWICATVIIMSIGNE